MTVKKGSFIVGAVAMTIVLLSQGMDAMAAKPAKANKTDERQAQIYTDYKLQAMNSEASYEYFLERETEEQKDIRKTRAREKRRAQIKARKAVKRAAKAAQRKAEKKQKRQAVVDYAVKFRGNPYVYGGTSLTKGTDCSGFVMSVYEHFGVSLPHSSYGQRSVGRSVSYKNIQPGDIVCYSGHVGIYAGNGKIINAIDERRDIDYTNVNYSPIIAIRRIF